MVLDFGLINNGGLKTTEYEANENQTKTLGTANIDYDTNNTIIVQDGDAINYTVPAGKKLYITDFYFCGTTDNATTSVLTYTLSVAGVQIFEINESRNLLNSNRVGKYRLIKTTFNTPWTATEGQHVTTTEADTNYTPTIRGFRGVLRPI